MTAPDSADLDAKISKIMFDRARFAGRSYDDADNARRDIAAAMCSPRCACCDAALIKAWERSGAAVARMVRAGRASNAVVYANIEASKARAAALSAESAALARDIAELRASCGWT